MPANRPKPQLVAMLFSTAEEHLLNQGSIDVQIDGPVEIFDFLDQVYSLGGRVSITRYQTKPELKLSEVSINTDITYLQVFVDSITPDNSPVADAIPPVLLSPVRDESKPKTLWRKAPALCDDDAAEVEWTVLYIIHDRGKQRRMDRAIWGELTFKAI